MQRRLSFVDPGPRPHPQTGRSATQDLHKEAQKLLSNFRRMKTDRDEEEVIRFNNTSIGYLPDKDFTILEHLRNAVFQLLQQRLRQYGVEVPKMKEKHLDWCLPKSLDQQAEWRLLLEDPLVVTTQMIGTMINLTACTPDTAAPEENQNVFYIRTFTMRVSDARLVLQALLFNDQDRNPRIFAWVERINALNDNYYVSFRYCGQTKNAPWERHSSDAYSKSLNSFMGDFYRVLGMDCPEVLSSATVHVLTHATAEYKLDADALNLREQLLIALFGDGVLNTEFGGKDIIVLTPRDRQIVQRLKTDTVGLMRQTAMCSNQTRADIHEYALQIREYVKTHPTTRKGNKQTHTFSTKTMQMIERQGTPRQLSDGSAVMVALGSDIGDTHEEDEGTFFEAGGRSADAVTYVYNHFGYWEPGALVSYLDPSLTRTLAKEEILAFVDLFAWFVKHKDDYPASGPLTRIYMDAVKPLIVITYGLVPAFAASQNFATFTYQEFEKMKKRDQRRNGDGHWVRNVMAVPHIQAFNGGEGPSVGKEFVMIPCTHPGLAGHVGVCKDKLVRLFVLTHALNWRGMHTAVQLDLTRPSLSRGAKCQLILNDLNDILKETHEFGRALMIAKREYIAAVSAWHQNSGLRKGAAPIRKPARGLLARKLQRAGRRLQIDPENVTVEPIGETFEVQIDEVTYPGGPGVDKKRHRLTWTGEDGQQWSIGPVILPKNTVPEDRNEKRYLTFTPGGLDIRSSAGLSLGDRKSLPNKHTKLETLPIASLVLTLAEVVGSNTFFEHWEDVTGTLVNEALVEHLPPDCSAIPSATKCTGTAYYYPAEFFADSRSKRAMPFTSATKVYGVYLAKVQKEYLPANPGDLLWLIDQFLSTSFQKGGQFDMISASLQNTSVFILIAYFCSLPTYKHHPHIRTFLAFASMAEMGMDERNVPSTALTIACELLRASTEKKSKTANLKKMKSASRYVITLKGDDERPENLMRAVDEPELVQDIEVEADVTDDEDEVEDKGDSDHDKSDGDPPATADKKHDSDDESDDDNGGHGGSSKVAARNKGKGKAVEDRGHPSGRDRRDSNKKQRTQGRSRNTGSSHEVAKAPKKRPRGDDSSDEHGESSKPRKIAKAREPLVRRNAYNPYLME